MILRLAVVLISVATMLWDCNPSQHGIFFKWNGVSTYSNGQPLTNNVKYVIYRSTNSINYSVLASTPLGTTNYADTTVVSGTTYYYKVTAKDFLYGTESKASNILSLQAK